MFRRDEIVRPRDGFTVERYNSYQRDHLDETMRFRVTRAYNSSSVIRNDVTERSYQVDNYRLIAVEEAPVDGRTLGTPPEDGDPILPDDPRLDWLWKDAAQLAVQTGQCSTYDEFCNKLGIPGRERDFSISVEIGGMSTSFKQKARSKAEAQRLVEENFKKLASGQAAIKTS